MRGISISSVRTSGARARILSRATYGSGAAPTISISGSSLSASARIFRTIAESSTIRTRIFRLSDIGARSAFPQPDSSRADLQPQVSRHGAPDGFSTQGHARARQLAAERFVVAPADSEDPLLRDHPRAAGGMGDQPLPGRAAARERGQKRGNPGVGEHARVFAAAFG